MASALYKDTNSSSAGSAACSSAGSAACSSTSCFSSQPNERSSPLPHMKEEQAVGVPPHASIPPTKKSPTEKLGKARDNLKGNITVNKSTSSRLWEEVESCLVAVEGFLKDSVVSDVSQ